MPSVDMTEAEFRELFEAVSTWGRWDGDGERGALNNLTPARTAAAARLVRSGVTVTLSQPLRTVARIDMPEPADHHMTMLTDVDIGSGSVRFAKDYVGVDYHNDGHSHIDAFSHVAYEDRLYGGVPAESVTAEGAGGRLDRGLEGRPRGARRSARRAAGAGRFLDRAGRARVPRGPRGRRARPGGDGGDRRHPAGAHGSRPAPGRARAVGHRRSRRPGCTPPRRRSWPSAASPSSVRTATTTPLPSTTEGVAFPIHVLAINAMGIHLLDYLQFEDLVPRCEAAGRWEFLFAAAPLRIVRGTGSPLNPTAIF